VIVLNKHRDVVPPGAIYIGRPSALGNAFSHLPNTLAQYRVATREEAIEAYRRDLATKIKARNQNVLKALSALSEDSVLVCWCTPLACHGLVIEKAWRYCRDQGLLFPT
jgi:hypothetical protein